MGMNKFTTYLSIISLTVCTSVGAQQTANLESDKEFSIALSSVTNDETSISKKACFTMADLKMLAEQQQELERKYRAKLRRSVRWQKRSLRHLDNALEDLDVYEDKTLDRNFALTGLFSTLESCEADEEPVEIAKVQELHNFMWELKDYYQLLHWQWNKTLEPAVGISINSSQDRINQLLDNRKALLALEDPSTIKDIKIIDQKLALSIDKLEILYKDSLATAQNSSEVYRHLDFMHTIYPIIQDEVQERIVNETNPTEREILTRHYAAVMYDLNEQYIETIKVARESHRTSLDYLKKNNEAPEQIQKFKAQRIQIKELMKRVKNDNYEAKPYMEMAASENE